VATIRAFGRQSFFVKEAGRRVDRNSRVYHHLWSANRWLAVRLQLLGGFMTGMVGVYTVATLGHVPGPVAGLVLLYSMSFAEAMNQLIRSQVPAAGGVNPSGLPSAMEHIVPIVPALGGNVVACCTNQTNSQVYPPHCRS
jgi:hypothetical protein